MRAKASALTDYRNGIRLVNTLFSYLYLWFIMHVNHPRLSSLATPAFAIDLPEGGGKVSIQENYYDGECYETIFASKVKYPEQL